MKKKISLFIATLMTVIALPAATFAASGTTDISGVVTLNGNPVKHAQVTVTCGENSKTTKTDKNGAYLVHFGFKKCPKGSTVNVSATSGPNSGDNSGPVNSETPKLNVALVNVSLVPEFGLITAGTAAIIGGAAFMVIRRRNLSGQEA